MTTIDKEPPDGDVIDEVKPQLKGMRRGKAAALKAAVELGRKASQWDPFALANITTRIVVVNVVALAILVGGVMALERYRENLIDVQIRGMKQQAAMIAAQIRNRATTIQPDRLDQSKTIQLLSQMYLPNSLRVQVYDARGRLIADSRFVNNRDQSVELRDLSSSGSRIEFLKRLDDILVRATRIFSPQRKVHHEISPSMISQDPTVYSALSGYTAHGESVNSRNQLIMTATAPIRRVKFIRGAVALSTTGGYIDSLLATERRNFLHVVAIAMIISVLVSFVLASQIAWPLRRLARAADAGDGAVSPENVKIPDLTDRGDEIGVLSGSLRRMTAALYARIRAIESFAADVAHEIKNPLSSLRSAVETLRFARTEEQRDKLYSVIEHDVRRLDRLVTDISAASRLDAELVQSERETLNLRTLLDAVISVAQPNAEKRSIEVALDADPNLDCEIRGLEARLAQVFHNLLDNAISFSPEGGRVFVHVEPISMEKGPGLSIKVLDEGPGIPEEALERIFNRFYTQRPTEEAFGQHSGLGLNIARQIVEAHDGQIYADNRPEGGAVFSVELYR